MAHRPKPFFKKSRSAWYVQLNGRQHNLGPDEDKLCWSSDFHQPFGGHVPPTYDGRRRHNC